MAKGPAPRSSLTSPRHGGPAWSPPQPRRPPSSEAAPPGPLSARPGRPRHRPSGERHPDAAPTAGAPPTTVITRGGAWGRSAGAAAGALVRGPHTPPPPRLPLCEGPVAWGADVVAVLAKCGGEKERNDCSCARVMARKYPFLQSVWVSHLVQNQILMGENKRSRQGV